MSMTRTDGCCRTASSSAGVSSGWADQAAEEAPRARKSAPRRADRDFMTMPLGNKKAIVHSPRFDRTASDTYKTSSYIEHRRHAILATRSSGSQRAGEVGGEHVDHRGGAVGGGGERVHRRDAAGPGVDEGGSEGVARADGGLRN